MHRISHWLSRHAAALFFPAALILYDFSAYLTTDLIQPGILHVVRDFNADVALAPASVSLYMAGGMALQWLLGPLSDRIGRRPVLLTGALIFTLACLATLFTTSMTQFLIARFVQGTSICFIATVGYVTVQEAFEEKRSIRLMAVITSVVLVAPIVGPLSGAALNVYAGRVMALVGENGAGKSTMMKVLTGIYTRDAGSLLWLGKEMTFNGPKSSQEAGIGIIHQELNLIPQLTIAENIFLGREFVNRFGKIDWKQMYAEADKLLAKLNLRFTSQKLVGDLSIGDQQMVEIAKVLSFESKVIIMDEPTDALTDTETESLFRVIRELKSQGRGIVYISHRMKEIFEICDDVTVFRDGQFIAEREVSSLDEDRLIEMMVGRKLEDQYPHLDKAPGAVRLKVDNLCGPGVDNVTFTLRQGEILGVAGLMGAGRTELMKVLYGALPRSSGSVTLDGREVVTRSPQDGLANGIVYISEDRKRDGLVLGMSVKENMSLTALRYFSRAGGSLKHKDEQQAVSDFIRLFNVKTPSMEQAIGLLSGGNQQKVAIARGLMTRPKVLILDEPTRGVDVGAKKEIYQLINQFKADGLSIILVSSEMPEVLGMSDRIIVMHEGHLGGEFTREQATQEVLMAAAVGKLNRVNQE